MNRKIEDRDYDTSNIVIDNYITRLNKFGKDIITEEIYNILDGDNIPYDCDKIFDKYGIVKDPAISLIKPKDYLRSNEKIITIDPKNTYLKDDAISISKANGIYKLKIFVADPNTFCLEEGYLLDEARRRAETIYLEHESVGIFTREIIAYYMSLEQSCNRHARVYEFDISEIIFIIRYFIPPYPVA